MSFTLRVEVSEVRQQSSIMILEFWITTSKVAIGLPLDCNWVAIECNPYPCTHHNDHFALFADTTAPLPCKIVDDWVSLSTTASKRRIITKGRIFSRKVNTHSIGVLHLVIVIYHHHHYLQFIIILIHRV